MKLFPIILITNTLSAITTTTTTATNVSSVASFNKYQRKLSRDTFLPSEKNVVDISSSPTESPTKSPIVIAIVDPDGNDIDNTDNASGGSIGTDDRSSETANGSVSPAPFIAIGAVAFVIAGAYLQRKYIGGRGMNNVQSNSLDDDDEEQMM